MHACDAWNDIGIDNETLSFELCIGIIPDKFKKNSLLARKIPIMQGNECTYTCYEENTT
jgi:hypothetical protein